MHERNEDYYNTSNHHGTMQMIRWSVIALCSMIAVITCAAAFTNGPVAARVACFPYSYSCTIDRNPLYNTGNETCRCEKLPGATP